MPTLLAATPCWPTFVGDIETDHPEIYPNPVEEYLNIESVDSKSKYAIFNIYGKMLVSGVFEKETSINTRTFPAGIYFIKINSNTQKFSKLD